MALMTGAIATLTAFGYVVPETAIAPVTAIITAVGTLLVYKLPNKG